MSMHNTPLTDLERAGLEVHHLPIGKPSQLSDCFRLGVNFALQNAFKGEPDFWMDAKGNTIMNGMKKSYPNACARYTVGLYLDPEVANG